MNSDLGVVKFRFPTSHECDIFNKWFVATQYIYAWVFKTKLDWLSIKLYNTVSNTRSKYT